MPCGGSNRIGLFADKPICTSARDVALLGLPIVADVLSARSLPIQHEPESVEELEMSVFFQSRSRSMWPVALLYSLCFCCGWSIAQEAPVATEEDSDVVVTDAAADPFAVPEGTTEELLAYIEGLAKPTQQFASQEEFQQFQKQALIAIGTAADKILVGTATDLQLSDAVQWKMASLNAQQQRGDENAEQQIEEFLNRMAQDGRPAVAGALAQIRLHRSLGNWDQLDATQRKESLDQYVAAVRATGLTRDHIGMLMQLDNALSDTPDSALAGNAINELLPLFHESSDPKIAELGNMMDAIIRRMNLPGKKIELEGTLLDGSSLDWEAYRGKVVLVDFWATWCGPCRVEVPNIVEYYQAYRDKGFEVLGICLDEDRAQAEQYMQEAGMEWPTLFSEDPQHTGWEHPMAVKYAITGIPRAILVNQEGVVVSMMARGLRLRTELKKLLGEPNVVPAAAEQPAAEQEDTSGAAQ